jgi:hypothetical protein
MLGDELFEARIINIILITETNFLKSNIYLKTFVLNLCLNIIRIYTSFLTTSNAFCQTDLSGDN